jgi:hypothetical protein
MPNSKTAGHEPARTSAAGGATSLETRIGKLKFESGYPSREAISKLYDEMDFQRACQAYLWGLPIVGMAEWKNANDNVFKVRNGQLVSFLTFDEKLGILTPNFTTPYICTTADLQKSGPLVLEIPQGLMAGMILDFWQRVCADLGVVGPDQGKGGKFLMLPPGHADVEADGYFIVRPSTRNVFFGVRLLDADNEKAIKELVPQLRSYPYSERERPPPEQVVPAGDRKWSQMPPRGMAYWERLAEILQQEAVQERDGFIMAELRFLGIEKGKPFQPDERQERILTEGALVGEAMAKANTSDKRVEQPFWPDTRWKHALVVSVDQHAQGFEQLDERAAWFYEAVSVSKAMLTETPGVGQRYIAAYQDKDGHWLDTAKSYRLHVPPNAPAKRFWSVTVYDEDTRQLHVSPTKKPDLSSRNDIVTNADGSVDVYFGPTPPPKRFEKNWIQTAPGKGWFAYFRFYGPTEAFFDKSWTLPDIEKVKPKN